MEINNIINELKCYKRRTSFYYLSKFDKTIFTISISIILFLSVLSLIIEQPIALLLSMGVLVVCAGINVRLSIKECMNPSRNKLRQAGEDLEQQMAIANSISKFSSKNIGACISWFERDIERLKSHTGFLIGAIEKLGLIPALIGLYIAYEKLAKQDPFTSIVDLLESRSPAIFLVALIAGVYVGTFRLKLIINSQYDATLILSHAKLVAECRESND